MKLTSPKCFAGLFSPHRRERSNLAVITGHGVERGAAADRGAKSTLSLSAFTFVLLMLLPMAALVACGSGDDGPESAQPTGTVKTLDLQPTATPSLPPDAVAVLNKDLGGSGEYRFDPSAFRFQVGQEVTFALISETEFHTFTVDDLDIDVSMDAGETVLFTFTFDTPGTYELICIPHQSLGMVGEIVVE